MIRHAELTDDLHFAKVRTFSGNPSLITPDFVDQILIDSQNRVYKSYGVSQGNLTQLIALTDSTGLEIGYGKPTLTPESINLFYYDWQNQDTYVSRHTNSVNGWVNTRRVCTSNLYLNNQSSCSPSEVLKLLIFHADTTLEDIQNGYSFGTAIREISNPSFSGAIDVTDLINFYGVGGYAFKVLFDESTLCTQEIPLTSVSGVSGALQAASSTLTGVDSETVEYALQADFAFISELPEGGNIDFNLNWI